MGVEVSPSAVRAVWVRHGLSRCHQGYRTQGRTPYKAFLDGLAALDHGKALTPSAA